MQSHYRFTSLALIFLLLVAGLVHAVELRLANDARIYSNGSWITVSELRPGDIVEAPDGRRVRITSVADVETAEPVSCFAFSTNESGGVFIADAGLAVSATAVCNGRCRFTNWLKHLAGHL